MTKQCIHARVSGKVQGVCFRAETQVQAQRLGLTGWVRNTEDGCVEVMACGDEKAINLLTDWLAIGPARAKVLELKTSEKPFQDFPGFEIGFL